MISNMQLSQDQQHAFDTIISGKNVFLTGKAGTGKSTVLKTVIDYYKKKKLNVAVLATTGIAASNIGGQTMHSYFKLPINGVSSFEKCFYVRYETREVWNNTHIVIIDEVSMLRADTFDSINWTLKKNKTRTIDQMQFIFVGDLSQLPPVVKGDELQEFESKYDGYNFIHSETVKGMDLQEISLSKIHRQTDPVFIDNLNIIRSGGKSDYFKQFVHDKSNGIILCPYKATADNYNNIELDKIDSEKFISKAEIEGEKIRIDDFNLIDNLVVKNGAKIMYLINEPDRDLYNGAIGELEICNNKLYIHHEGKRKRIYNEKFEKKEYYLHNDKLKLRTIGHVKQYPIKLAYALTIHKSQGLTFDNITIDLSKRCFEKGQLYTALSRVRTPEGLRIIL